MWIYPSSRIDRGGRIYGDACVCVRRRWLCCIARSRRAVHFRGGRSVATVRPGDVIYLSDGRQCNTAAPIDRAQRPRVEFPTTPICTLRGLYTHHPRLTRTPTTTLRQPFRGTSDQSRADIRTHLPTHARIVRDTTTTTNTEAGGYQPHVPHYIIIIIIIFMKKPTILSPVIII